MSSKKTLNEQIESAQAEIKQKENRLKELVQKQKAQERKNRNHRLIQRGLILESMIDGAEMFSNEEIKTLLQNIFDTPYARNMLAAFLRKSSDYGSEYLGKLTE